MTAPSGAVVKLYVDSARRIAPGDVVQTEAGRRYLLQSVRVQERGKHAGRQHFTAVVMHPDEPTPPDAFVLVIRWYRR